MEKLQQRCVEQSDASAKQAHDRNILSGENTELRKTNDLLSEKVVCLQRSLEGEIQKNADMAKQVYTFVLLITWYFRNSESFSVT